MNDTTLVPPPPKRAGVRPRLAAGFWLGALLALPLASGALGRIASRHRPAGQPDKETASAAGDRTPAVLRGHIYLTTPALRFPEFTRPRFRPGTHPIGVCFSGGGPMSAAASTGQMRGLHGLGIVDRTGAISCVSGGAWFGTIYSYAPAAIADETLLGPPV